MTKLDVLIAARAKVEQGWCQGAYAKDASGAPVMHDSPNACCWCIAGALTQDNPTAELEALNVLHGSIESGGCGVVEFNDAPGRTQQEVLALFDRAIEAAKE